MDKEYKNLVLGCQNCKLDFIIEPDDFLFYEKIKVPAPTFCPECRFTRRMIWRNERSLYKRKCDMCEKSIISMYDDKVSFPVYCPECYKGDNWGAETYEKDYDFSKSFFEQWKELFNKVPIQGLWSLGSCINSEYANFIEDVKNVYLSYSILWGAEDVSFSSNIDKSKQIIDSYNITNSELIYEGMGVDRNYNSKYAYWSSNCINCDFILDCNNCQDCFGCVNLQNKRYCIWNKQYLQNEYEKKIVDFNIGSYKSVEEVSKSFRIFSLNYPRRCAKIINCINSIGDEMKDCKNSIFIFNSYSMEDVKFSYRSVGSKNSMDVCHNGSELAYEHVSGGSMNSMNVKFVINGSKALKDVDYIDYCKYSSNLFGCIGLKNKQYCILNKQYAEEEYFEMVEKIKKHMDEMPYVDKKGNVYKYGEFFPAELCPFGYNEAVINDHFPLTKEEILEKGYNYKEKIDNKYTITLKVCDIPDDIKDINDSILDEVIECEKSGKAFKITPFELQFYKRMNIPIPHLHPDERYKERMKLRNPMVLYRRTCMKEGCSNEFETTYAPDRMEIIYCEQCYKNEVF